MKELTEEQKEKLSRMLNGDFGFGKYKGATIVSEKPVDSTCIKCGSRLYLIKTTSGGVRKSNWRKYTLFLILPIAFILLVAFFVGIVKFELSSYLGLRALVWLMIGIVCGGISFVIYLERKATYKTICKVCDREFLDT